MQRVTVTVYEVVYDARPGVPLADGRRTARYLDRAQAEAFARTVPAPYGDGPAEATVCRVPLSLARRWGLV